MSSIKNQVNKLLYYVSKDLLEYVKYKTAIISNLLLSVIMVKSFGDFSMAGGFGNDDYYLYILPGIIAMGMMNNCIFSASYNVAMDSEKHLTDDVVISVSSYLNYMIAKYIGNFVKALIQFLVVVLLSVYFYNISINNLGLLLGFFTIGTVMFISIGMLLAAFTDILSLGGLANLIIVPFTYFSGIFFPVTTLDGVIKVIAKFLPITPFIETLRYAISSEVMFGNLGSHVIYITLVTVILVLVTLIKYYKKLKRGY